MRCFTRTTLAMAVSLTLAGGTHAMAQVAAGNVPQANRVTIAALTPADLAESTDLITRMTEGRDLLAYEIHDDQAVAGRRHESFRQYHRGVPVEGGGITRQMAGAATVSIFGTLHTNIAIDVAPALTAVDATRIVERAAGRGVAFGIAPSLVVLPSPLGTYALAYRATVADAITYYVDAMTGDVLRTVSERNDDVGVGTGVLGDQKKISTSPIGGAFRARDTLRPATISTFDTNGNTVVFDRLLNTGVFTDGDLAANGTNTWTDGRLVDAHVHTGWAYDYFFRRHGWSGLDGANRPISDVVHRALKNNASFYPAPFGPGGNGMMVYGETTAGVPVTALDIVTHELMHGVTSFSLRKRTGTGLLNAAYLDGLGPTTFTFSGFSYSCATTELVDSNDVGYPFLCNAGQYVLASNHGSIINEAFSDIFGTSAEFMFHAPGSGALRADYLIAEDVSGFGPIRSLNNPASIGISTDTGTVAYPDHRTRQLAFALVIVQGTRANPITVEFAPVAFVNGSQVLLFTKGVDGGGVHLNSTVLSHAFYLAVEGGRNATSGLSVTGVGAANRELVERAFFRAMTQLMPNAPDQGTAARAVYQAAVDLYGSSSATTNAILQAMVAVGLFSDR